MTNLLYRRVADDLRNEMDRGAFEAGVLPTEAALCERFGTSRSTIRKALQLLRSEGLVVSRQGSGWITTPSIPPMRIGVHASSEAAAADHAKLSPVGCKQTTPPEAVAVVLRAPADVELLLVERVAIANGTVVHRAETWFAHWIGDGLDRHEAETEPPALLLSRLGYALAEFEQFAEAVRSDVRDEELVGVPAGSPMLQITRIAYDPKQQPLFVSLHRHPGDSTRISVDLPTTDKPDGRSVALTRVDP